MARSQEFRRGFAMGLSLPIWAVMAAIGVWRHAWRHCDEDQLEADVRRLWGQRKWKPPVIPKTEWPHGRHCTIPNCPHCGGLSALDAPRRRPSVEEGKHE